MKNGILKIKFIALAVMFGVIMACKDGNNPDTIIENTAPPIVVDNEPDNNNKSIISVTLDKDILTVEVGRTEILTAIIKPSNADDIVLQWTSSDETKATVNSNGIVTGVSAGKAKITVTSSDGSITAECAVTVNSVYILGNCGYWVDGVWVKVDNVLDTGYYYTLGLAVSDGKVYVSGSYLTDNYRKACYWVDGVRFDLSDENGMSSATGIFIFDKKIYIAGWYISGNSAKACYWTDGFRTVLPVGTGNSMALDICVSNGKVYAVGAYGKIHLGVGYPTDVEELTICYWADGKKIDLPDKTSVIVGLGYKISVSDGVVYISGTLYRLREETTGIHYPILACYWADGKRFDLSEERTNDLSHDNSKIAIANCITISNKQVFVGGRKNNACYWIDGEKIDLSGDYAYAINISGDKVYIAGETSSKACYWVNGERIDLFGSFINGYNSVIVVVSE